jgi:hypothetical protein
MHLTDIIYFQGKDKQGREFIYECKDLLDLHVDYSFFRRKSLNENCRLDNEIFDQKNNRHWGRKCLVVVNSEVRTKLQRLTTVARLCDVSVCNDVITLYMICFTA